MPSARIEDTARSARTSTARSGQARKPDLRWLAFAGAAAFVLFGIVIIIRDEKGNEKARLKLDGKDKIEIVQDGDESNSSTAPATKVIEPNKTVCQPFQADRALPRLSTPTDHPSQAESLTYPQARRLRSGCRRGRGI